MGGRRSFAQELAERAAFPRRYWMHAGISALGPTYMQAPGGEVDVVPAQRHQLRGPKTMAVSDQDSRGVPMPRAVVLGGLDELLDLAIGEIFTAALANCYNGSADARRAAGFRTSQQQTIPSLREVLLNFRQ